MSVGENIRRYRKLRGMTQAQLAEAVGLISSKAAADGFGASSKERRGEAVRAKKARADISGR